jgi:Ca2+-binding RTX toxin-like protein
MEGGNGNDSYIVDNLGDRITELADQGYDRVYTSVDYTLPDNVEEGIVQNNSGGEVHLRGNSADNALTGSNGNDWLDGGAGNDWLSGGQSGVDIFHFQGQFGNDYIDFSTNNIINIVEFEGFNSTDAIIIDTHKTTQIIKIGNNSVTYCYKNGGAFSPRYDINTFKFDDGIFSIGKDAKNNLIWVKSNAIFGTDGADRLTGTNYNDVIYGLQGDDIIDGGFGSDILVGGAGNDTYYVTGSTRIIEIDGEGIDTVVSNGSVTLGDNVENLILIGSELSWGTGNGLDNIIIGNNGINHLWGEVEMIL